MPSRGPGTLGAHSQAGGLILWAVCCAQSGQPSPCSPPKGTQQQPPFWGQYADKRGSLASPVDKASWSPGPLLLSLKKEEGCPHLLLLEGPCLHSWQPQPSMSPGLNVESHSLRPPPQPIGYKSYPCVSSAQPLSSSPLALQLLLAPTTQPTWALCMQFRLSPSHFSCCSHDHLPDISGLILQYR